MHAFPLPSGASLQFSSVDGEWMVVSVLGAAVPAKTVPKATLLLLEHDPTQELLVQLDGFPFESVVAAARKSGSPRLLYHADRWASALALRER